jgi:hypothetical protein
MNFFKIGGRSIIPGDWGDYGDILQHGMTAHLPRLSGRLALERTGPYIPPITLPGISDIILTFEAQKLLASSRLSGFSFLPVEKILIVELPWENWDLNAEEPAEFPESGEPEDYILGRQHSQNAAAALGELWEIVVPRTARILRPQSVVSSYTDLQSILNSYKDLQIDLSTWNGADLFRGDGYGSILFSEHARDWFTRVWGRYVQFDSFSTT